MINEVLTVETHEIGTITGVTQVDGMVTAGGTVIVETTATVET